MEATKVQTIGMPIKVNDFSRVFQTELQSGGCRTNDWGFETKLPNGDKMYGYHGEKFSDSPFARQTIVSKFKFPVALTDFSILLNGKVIYYHELGMDANRCELGTPEEEATYCLFKLCQEANTN
jgi:hypothetical protein